MNTKNTLSPKTMLRQYRVEKVLGQGGFGITYLAYDTELERNVAIKECFPRDFVAREGTTIVPTSSNTKIDYDWALDKFIAEATTLAKFRHPGIVQVLQILKGENNSAYMVLEFIDGQSLDQWLKSLSAPPKQAQLQAIIDPLLDALTAVHRAKFAHRDIAPDNIYIRKSGEAVLLDFGAAKLLAAQHSKTMNLVVKDGYSAPEQYYAEGRQGPWTDIYAFSATLYRCLSGKKPIDAMARLDAKNNGEPDPLKPCAELDLTDYTPEFLRAVDLGLSPQSKSRPQDISSWRKLLLPAETNATSLSPPETTTADTPPSRAEKTVTPANKSSAAGARIGKGLIAAGLATTIAVGAGAAYWLYQQQQIAAEARAWELASTADTTSAYEKFLKSFPDSNSRTTALQALKALADPWEKTLDDMAGGIQALHTGSESILIAGYSDEVPKLQKQAYLSEMSRSGKSRWSVTIGEEGDQSFNAITRLPNDDVVAIGYSLNSEQKNKQGLLAQYSGTGELKWSRSIGGPGTDELFAVTTLSNGNIAAAGTTSKISGGTALAWLVELSTKGELVNQRVFDTPDGGAFRSIEGTPGGGFFLAGNTNQSAPENAKFWMKKLSSDGSELLNRTFGRTHDQFNAVVPGPNGDFILVGETKSFGTNTVDGIAVRLSADNKMQPAPFLDTGDNSLKGVAIAANGNIYTAGHTTSGSDGAAQAWFLEVSKNLRDIVQTETFRGHGIAHATDIATLPDQSIVIVGNTRKSPTATSLPWIKRLSPTP